METTHPATGPDVGNNARSKGSPDPGDSIVAATGLASNRPTVGRDGDFDAVEGFQIETY